MEIFFFDSYLEKYGRKLVFLCNLRQKDASQLKIKDRFFKEIVEYWSNSNYSYSFPVNICMYLA